jgi:membrane protein
LKFYNRYAVNVIRVIILAFKGFKKDECPIRSSALTYFTMLSIVPVVAVAFAIAKGFGLEQVLEQEITKALSAQKEVMTYLLKFSKKHAWIHKKWFIGSDWCWFFYFIVY